MNKDNIRLLGEAIKKTGGTVFQYIEEVVIPKEDGSLDINLPIGHLLWATRINVDDDDTIDQIKLYRHTVYRFEDYWEGIKAIAYIYLGRVELPGFATIFWSHVFGQVEGLDLREEMIGHWKLRIIPFSKTQKIKVKLQYILIDAAYY